MYGGIYLIYLLPIYVYRSLKYFYFPLKKCLPAFLVKFYTTDKEEKGIYVYNYAN